MFFQLPSMMLQLCCSSTELESFWVHRTKVAHVYGFRKLAKSKFRLRRVEISFNGPLLLMLYKAQSWDKQIVEFLCLLILSKVFRKQVSCNASVGKTYFIQFCVQRLRECYYFEQFYLKLPLGKLSSNLWTKNTDFHYILLGF